MKDSFVFYRDWLNVMEQLPAEIQLELYQAVAQYALNGKTPTLSPMAKIAFGFIQQSLDRDQSKYEKIVETNKLKGRLGNLKRYYPDIHQRMVDGELSLEEAEQLATAIKTSPNKNKTPSATTRSPNDNDNDNDNDLSFLEKKKQKKECVSPENFFQKENSFLEAPLNDSSEEEKKEKEKISAQKEKEAQKKETSFDFRAAMLAEGFAPDLVDEWLKIRKAKKAINSEHAFELFLEQVQLTQQEKNTILKLIVQKQWKGFEASWLETLSHPSLNRKEPITIDQNGNILNPTYFNTTSTNTSPYVAGRQTAETLRANLQGW